VTMAGIGRAQHGRRDASGQRFAFRHQAQEGDIVFVRGLPVLWQYLCRARLAIRMKDDAYMVTRPRAAHLGHVSAGDGQAIGYQKAGAMCAAISITYSDNAWLEV
jgi:hypothetical protein